MNKIIVELPVVFSHSFVVNSPRPPNQQSDSIEILWDPTVGSVSDSATRMPIGPGIGFMVLGEWK